MSRRGLLPVQVLQPLDAELWTLGALDKIRACLSTMQLWLGDAMSAEVGAFNGQLLLLHGLADELAAYSVPGAPRDFPIL